MNPIGKRIRIIGRHPHQGENGIIETVEESIFGTGYIVKLDHCPRGTKKCYVSYDNCVFFSGSKILEHMLLAIIIVLLVTAPLWIEWLFI